MNKTTEALKLAEEALENYGIEGTKSVAGIKCTEALAAIREALPEQEPVIWHSVWDFVDVRRDPPEQGDEANWLPLYAAPVSVEAEWIETNKALAKEIIEQRNQYLDKLAEAIDLSVKAEREACAKVCDMMEWRGRSDEAIWKGDAADECAAAIRARGEK